MIRSSVAKFPNSVQLFKFCQKVLSDRKGSKVHDQEVGSVLSFNPSDCSHWKRGEKNVKSVFALAKLADHLGVEVSLVHDVASGAVGLDEAYFEYVESKGYTDTLQRGLARGKDQVDAARRRVEQFVKNLHAKADFHTPPLYIPEILRFFPYVTNQPSDMLDKLSRILRVRPGQYTIQTRKGELKAQTRMSMAKDLARVIFEVERAKNPELGELDTELLPYEQLVFVANLLIPKDMLLDEMKKLDSRQNVLAELAALFWVPKSLLGFQMQEILRSGERLAPRRERAQKVDVVPEVAMANP